MFRKAAIVSTAVILSLQGLASQTAGSLANSSSEAERMSWFQEAKFGMFVHWGPYSYLAGAWNGLTIPVGTEAEWIMQRFNIPAAQYRVIAHQLNPIHFDAEAWVQLAKATGMKYLIFTAKHHDGFAMYHSSVSRYNIVDWTQFKRDPVEELSNACRKEGIRFGIYYSHREDWDDPDGFGNTWDYDRSKKNFDRYLERKSKPQLRELLTRYGPISVVWFDRGMDTIEHATQFRDIVRTLQPACLINGRIGSYGQDLIGDYQDMNDNGIPNDGLQEYWEAPQTLNTTWGYSKFDQQWKTPGDVMHRLVEIVSKGGNYLLNVGPMADGTIPEESVRTLQTVGTWMRINGASIYGATAGPLSPQPWGRTTTKGSKLYLHVFSWPADNKLPLPGLRNKVVSAYPLASPKIKLETSQIQGTNVIAIGSVERDPIDSVLVAELDGAPQVDPPVVVQGTDTGFELDTMQAVTAGKAAKRFNRQGKLHIAKWTGPSDSATWHILVSQRGRYQIRIRYSSPPDSQAAKYAIDIGGHTIVASIQPTGEAFDYKTFDLGEIALTKVGTCLVRIAPLSETGHDVMFFQSLELIPDVPLMVE
jgi:alpha-L-fucosidase